MLILFSATAAKVAMKVEGINNAFNRASGFATNISVSIYATCL